MTVFWMIPPGMPGEKKFQMHIYAEVDFLKTSYGCTYER